MSDVPGVDPSAPGLEPPDPPLADEVIRLRPWTEADAAQIDAACQDPHIQQFIPIPRPYARADAEAYVARTQRQWATGEKAAFAISDVDDPTVVLGAVSLAVVQRCGNAAYWIAPGVRGMGLATRALGLLTDWAVESLGMGVILLEIHHRNEPSRRVAVAAGYRQVGQLEVPTPDGRRTHLIYAHLSSDRTTG